ncbi:MAG: hypothetical protein SO148_00200 [Candidatus Onthovivens sp.]|nr:hypothetical protein [Candidatus Onthovivens sp.]
MKKATHQQKIFEQSYKEIETYKIKLINFVIRFLKRYYQLLLISDLQINALLRQLEKDFKKYGINTPICKKCLNLARFLALKLKQDTKETDGIILATLLMKRFEKLRVYQRFISLVNQEVRNKEASVKEKVIRQLTSYGIENREHFALVSKHLDSAIDHINYQGKIYLLTNDLQESELLLANKLGITRTLASVMHDKPYLITRPNCRHYFITLSESDIGSKSVDTLLKENKMITKVGSRVIKNLRNNTSIKLNYYKELYKVRKIPYLASRIKKLKELVEK